MSEMSSREKSRDELIEEIHEHVDKLSKERLATLARWLNRHHDPIVWDLIDSDLEQDKATLDGVAKRLDSLRGSGFNRHGDPIVWDLISRILDWARIDSDVKGRNGKPVSRDSDGAMSGSTASDEPAAGHSAESSL